MSIFRRKREPQREHWLSQVELFANYYGDLKLDCTRLVQDVLSGDPNWELAEQLWERWDDNEKGCAFFFVLGTLEGVYGQIADGDWYE